MTRQIIVEEVGRRNVQIVASEATVDHEFIQNSKALRVSDFKSRDSKNLNRNPWKTLGKRGVRVRAAKKKKTTRKLICRHDSRRIPGVLDEQTKTVVRV